MHRRFNHEPKVSDEPLVRSSSPDQLNSDPHITARKAVDSHKDRSNEKNQAKKVKAQNRRNRRDQEFAKLTGRAFVTRKGQTGAPYTGSIPHKLGARKRAAEIKQLKQAYEEQEANLPPPGVSFDEVAANRKPKEATALYKGTQKLERKRFIPLVFGSRDRKVGLAFRRRADQMRNKISLLKQLAETNVSSRRMASKGDLLQYGKRMEKMLERNTKAHEKYQKKLGSLRQQAEKLLVLPSGGPRQVQREYGNILKLNPREKRLALEAGEKEVAVAKTEKDKSKTKALTAKDVKRARVETLLKLALEMKSHPNLKHLPHSNAKAEALLEEQRRLDELTLDERHLLSKKHGSERDMLSKVTPVHTRFHDCVYINTKAGSGGQGRLKSRSVGGDGGSVFVEAVKNVSLDSLANMKVKMFKSEGGAPAELSRLKGRNGNNLIISVPVGTVVSRMTESNKFTKIADLDKDRDKVLVARGGQGGSVFTAPAWAGVKGQAYRIKLELKMLADVGLVGFPNAGKSTLLSRLSRSTPKIASFPFTTLHPQIGQVQYPGGHMISMADLPGLIEGAHKNIGLGHRFLRHLERCKILLFLIDINGFQKTLHDMERTPKEIIDILAQELELYQEGLSQRPAILCITKMDSPNAVNNCRMLLDQLGDYLAEGATLPDLRQYKNFSPQAPEQEGDDKLKFLAAQNTLAQDMGHIAEDEALEVAKKEIDLGAVIEDLNESTSSISSNLKHAHISEFSVPDEDGAPVESRSALTHAMETENLGRTADNAARAKRQREQLHSLALADERARRKYIDPDVDLDLPRDEVPAPVPEMTSGDEELKKFLALADSQSALVNGRVPLPGNELAVRRHVQMKFRHVIPISCHQELQGLDNLYTAMRRVVMAAETGANIDFGAQQQQLLREEERAQAESDVD